MSFRIKWWTDNSPHPVLWFPFTYRYIFLGNQKSRVNCHPPPQASSTPHIIIPSRYEIVPGYAAATIRFGSASVLMATPTRQQFGSTPETLPRRQTHSPLSPGSTVGATTIPTTTEYLMSNHLQKQWGINDISHYINQHSCCPGVGSSHMRILGVSQTGPRFSQEDMDFTKLGNYGFTYISDRRYVPFKEPDGHEIKITRPVSRN